MNIAHLEHLLKKQQFPSFILFLFPLPLWQAPFFSTAFEEMVTSYTEQASALLDGGVDVLMVETIFDTLNAKAALYAIDVLLEEYERDVPVFVCVFKYLL